jgi:hypothetical protein
MKPTTNPMEQLILNSLVKQAEILAKATIKVKYQEVIEEIEPKVIKKFTKTKKK